MGPLYDVCVIRGNLVYAGMHKGPIITDTS